MLASVDEDREAAVMGGQQRKQQQQEGGGGDGGVGQAGGAGAQAQKRLCVRCVAGRGGSGEAWVCGGVVVQPVGGSRSGASARLGLLWL